MPTPTKGPRLGSGPAHERLMLAGLATALFERGRVVTTHTKAKRLRPVAERLITFARRGDLHARRQVLKVVHGKRAVHRLFTEIGPRYAERPGGYTRITRLGPRQGDGAPMAVIELVEAATVEQEVVGEAEQARGARLRRRRPAAARPAAAEPFDAGSAEAEEESQAEAASAVTGLAEPAAVSDAAEQTDQVAIPTEGGDEPPAEVHQADQVAVPTEGGDTEVVTEPAGPADAAGPVDAGDAEPVDAGDAEPVDAADAEQAAAPDEDPDGS
jgi:large subunit ribosomal protein L17